MLTPFFQDFHHSIMVASKPDELHTVAYLCIWHFNSDDQKAAILIQGKCRSQHFGHDEANQIKLLNGAVVTCHSMFDNNLAQTP